MAVYYITMVALIFGAYLFGNINVSIIISHFKTATSVTKAAVTPAQ